MDKGYFTFWMSAGLSKILDDKKPHHIGISWDLYGGAKLYIDGNLKKNEELIDNIKLYNTTHPQFDKQRLIFLRM